MGRKRPAPLESGGRFIHGAEWQDTGTNISSDGRFQRVALDEFPVAAPR
jgi:hypothetical protein